MTRPTSTSGLRRLSRNEAARVALAAQGFADRPHTRPTLRTFDRALARTGVIQVDSVNVFARAHLMPLWSRIGPGGTDLLQRAASGPERRVVEYWAHAQAFMPVELWPLMRHRMDEFRRPGAGWGEAPPAELVARVAALVASSGPVTAKMLDAEFGGDRNRDHWGWNWSVARRALDHLYRVGEVAVSGRTSTFEVVYDVPERVIPGEVLARPVPSREDAQRALVARALRHVGVGSSGCVADHYRMRRQDALRALSDLEESGDAVRVQVEGWDEPTWAVADLVVPRAVDASTLLSPFDPVVWNRERAKVLFDFDYRIEIYVPAAQRRYGYYVLPFLHEGRLAARVDLKADRGSGVLRVKGAFAEPDAPASTVGALAVELSRIGVWAGVPEVVVEQHGDLAAPLTGALAAL